MCVGLARTVYIHTHRTWLYIWWFPCQKYCIYTGIYTVYIWFRPTLLAWRSIAPTHVCNGKALFCKNSVANGHKRNTFTCIKTAEGYHRLECLTFHRVECHTLHIVECLKHHRVECNTLHRVECHTFYRVECLNTSQSGVSHISQSGVSHTS